MPRYNSTELNTIVGQQEIIIPDLCLFLIINVLIKICNSFRCVCWFPRLFLDQRVCRRKFGSRSAIFIFVCIYSIYAS
jgi:hypothetical protein